MGWLCQWLNWWQSKPCSRGQKGAVSLSCPLWSSAAEARRVRSVFLVHFGPVLRGQKGAVSLSCPLWSSAAEARRVRSVFLVHFGPVLRGLVELVLQLLVLHGLLQLRLLAVPAHSRQEAILIQNPPFAVIQNPTAVIIQNPTAVIIQNPSRCYNTKSTLCYNTKKNKKLL